MKGKAFGSAVRQLRKSRGLTQTQLANRSGFSTKHICDVENNKHSPKLSTIESILRACDSNLRDFFGGESTSSHKVQVVRSRDVNQGNGLAGAQGALPSFRLFLDPEFENPIETEDRGQADRRNVRLQRPRPTASEGRSSTRGSNPRGHREPELFGHPPSALVRWMGAKSFTLADAQAALNYFGISLAESGIRWQLRAGQKRTGVYARVDVPNITGAVAGQLLKFRSQKDTARKEFPRQPRRRKKYGSKQL